MINRYLGNKTELLGPIMDIVDNTCSSKARVCDIFAGTLSVSLELKRRGFSVISNDINLFSHTIGKAFLINSEVPNLDVKALVRRGRAKDVTKKADEWIPQLEGEEGFTFLSEELCRSRYNALLSILLYLQDLTIDDIPPEYQRSDFFDTYTEAGRNSSFVSRRGSRGRRRFFSADNGRHIDLIVNQLRNWRRNQMISETVYAVLTCVLMRAVEKISNTQGTYHDFPRESIDPRALNPLRLEAPPFDNVLTGGAHIVGRAEDSLEFVCKAPLHQLLYIDPPYNFRQYTSYYFLPNLLCRYADIENLDAYFADVQYVRGQNMEDDFVSTFCKKGMFIDSLRLLIERAETTTVVLSYFDGRNHWDQFDSESNGVGFEKIEQFFSTGLFQKRSLRVIPVPRKNYQSYGGYRARDVMEYLFIAEKLKG